MVAWPRLHLNLGTVGDERFIGEAGIREMHTPQIVRPSTTDPWRLGPGYGLGWFTEVYRGNEVIQHGGNIDGFTALVLFVPKEKLGIVILCNQGVSAFPSVAAYSVVDEVLGLSRHDWVTYGKEQMDKAMAAMKTAERSAVADQIQGTSPSHTLEAYTGEYHHPGYGAVRIEQEGNHLYALYHSWPGEKLHLSHLHYDVFVMSALMTSLQLQWKVPFYSGLSGDIEKLEIQFEAAADPIVFTRVAPATTEFTDELTKYQGNYLVAGVQPLTVATNANGDLMASLAGQPSYELVSERPGRFALKKLKGFAIQFEVNESGTCTGGYIIQPSGSFPFTRQN